MCKKNRFVRLIAIVLIGIILITIVSCKSKDDQASNYVNNENANIADADCIINGQEIYFVSDESKKEWEKPLAKLLSNVLVPYEEHGEIMGYEAAIDPNAPVIPQNYECGLLDITGDGTPELLIHPFGYHGSSGTATYFVYNIYSGQKLGEIDGGNDQSWCFYYDTDYGDLDLIGQYWLRGGWPWRGRYITKVFYDESYMECYEVRYLHTEHDINGKKTDIVDEDPNDGVYTATWVETYPNTTYYVYSNEVYLDDYYAEYNNFVMACIRIPETELVLIDWDDVAEDGDDYAIRGEKMAQALISSKQKFIDFNK